MITSISGLAHDPSVSSSIVRLNDIRWTSSAPAPDNKHDFMWHPRSCKGVCQIQFLIVIHVQIVEKFKCFNNEWFAVLIISHIRMALQAIKVECYLRLIPDLP